MTFSNTPSAHGNIQTAERQDFSSKSETYLESPKLAHATATRTRDGSAWKWTIERCPLCGKSHIHGGGDGGEPSGGHRVAHCQTAGGSSYVLSAGVGK